MIVLRQLLRQHMEGIGKEGNKFYNRLAEMLAE